MAVQRFPCERKHSQTFSTSSHMVLPIHHHQYTIGCNMSLKSFPKPTFWEIFQKYFHPQWLKLWWGREFLTNITRHTHTCVCIYAHYPHMDQCLLWSCAQHSLSLCGICHADYMETTKDMLVISMFSDPLEILSSLWVR